MAPDYIHGLVSLCDKLKRTGAGKMAQQVRELAMQAWQPQFDPYNPHNSGREEVFPQSYPNLHNVHHGMCVYTHVPFIIHT